MIPMEWIRGRTLGRGSSATVSLATSPASDDTFAVKSAELSRSHLLQREHRIMSALTSPHVVGYRGAGVTREGDVFLYNLLMDYAHGGTLADQIRRRGGRLPEATIGFYAGQIARGLCYLHSLGLAHCDIKGQNILIGDGGARIGDLGCAKWIGSIPDLEAPIAGTPAYMAPEVACGREQGFPADVWALGCTVIEMATGGAPWPGIEDPVSVLYKIGHSGESPGIPGFLSEEAKDFLRRCLTRDPKARWTAAQLIEHPFLKGNDSPNPVPEKTKSNSPTTVLEGDFWEEVEEPAGATDESPSRPSERIQQLSADSEMAEWRREEGWIAVRSHESEERTGERSGQEVEDKGDEMDACVPVYAGREMQRRICSRRHGWAAPSNPSFESRDCFLAIQ